MTMPRKKPPFPPPNATFGEDTVIGGEENHEVAMPNKADAKLAPERVTEKRDAEQYDYELTSVGSEVSAVGRKAEPMDAEKTVIGKPNMLNDAFDASTVVQTRPQRLGEKTNVDAAAQNSARQQGPPPIISRAVAVEERAVQQETNLKAMPKAPAAIDLHHDLLNEKTTVGVSMTAAQPTQARSVTTPPAALPVPVPAIERPVATQTAQHNAHEDHESDHEHDVEHDHGHEEMAEAGHSRLSKIKARVSAYLPWFKTRNGMIAVAVAVVMIFIVAHRQGDNDSAEVHQTEFASEGKPAHSGGNADRAHAAPVPPSAAAPAAIAHGGAPAPNLATTGGQGRTDSLLLEFDRAFAKTQDQR